MDEDEDDEPHNLFHGEHVWRKRERERLQKKSNKNKKRNGTSKGTAQESMLSVDGSHEAPLSLGSASSSSSSSSSREAHAPPAVSQE